MNDQIEITGDDLTAPDKYLVTLSSVGNPDRGQDHTRALPGVLPGGKVVANLAEASLVCSDYIKENELGAGNWSGGDVYLGYKLVARISYNGRVWAVPEATK